MPVGFNADPEVLDPAFYQNANLFLPFLLSSNGHCPLDRKGKGTSCYSTFQMDCTVPFKWTPTDAFLRRLYLGELEPIGRVLVGVPGVLYLGELKPVGGVLVGVPGVHLHRDPVLPAQLLSLLPGRVRGRQQELNLDTCTTGH